MSLVVLALLAVLGRCAQMLTFGASPLDYEEAQEVDVFMGQLSSTKTQLPYDHYSYPFCRPARLESYDGNLGQILSGEKIQTTEYSLRMKVDVKCHVLCTKELSLSDRRRLSGLIKEGYRSNMLIDDLPLAEQQAALGGGSSLNDYYYMKGYSIGQMVSSSEAALNNHVRFLMKYHATDSGTFRVVGAEAQPQSLHHVLQGSSVRSCSEAEDPDASGTIDRELLVTTNANPASVVFSYAVKWEEDPTVEWASRWDVYLRNVPGAEIHWFTLGNSLLIGVCMTVLVGYIMYRTVYRDIARYNSLLPLTESREDELEESGWKLVHGDVFRPPYYHGMFFSVLVGTGVQLLWMAVAVIFLLCVGFLSRAARGSVITATFFLFAITGSIGGYYAGRVYKYFKGQHWKTMTFATALFFPGVIFTLGMVMNIFSATARSTRTLPFTAVVILLLLWLGVSMPLVFIGSFYGLRRPEYEVPCRINDIPRQVQPYHWALRPIVTVLLSGILPFSAVLMELNTILSSIWLFQVFAVFFVIFFVFLITVVSVAEISIAFCYFQLVSEDYNWWWRSVFNGGSIGFYFFLYSIVYSFSLELSKLTSCTSSSLSPITDALFFGTMLMICFLVSVMSGGIGFFSCFWFNRKIYGSIKVD